MEKKIMNNWEIYNAENMIGDPEISEMEFYSTMPEDGKTSKVDDTKENIPELSEEESDTQPAEESVESPEELEKELEAISL